MKNIYEVNNVKSLISFLEEKGLNHNYYHHYTSWDSFKKIYSNKSFLLTRGNSLSINDHHEALTKGSWEIWNKTYIGSFAFGSSENMAMWGLYGLPWNDAVRISIPKAQMIKWIKSLKTVNIWDGEIKGTITPQKISLTDIAYIGGIKGSCDLKITHSDKSFSTSKLPELHKLDEKPEITGYIKNYAWHYENEVRLRVELFRDIGYDKVLLELPQDTLNAIRLTTGPYFAWKDDQLYTELCSQGRVNESGFKNLVNYRTLCSMCKYENFKRKQV